LLLPVKLADFGFAKSVEKKNGCRTLCGTPGYLAPEILERWPAYDVKCDVWSIGVILFLLLGGYLPFDDDDEDKVFDRTRNGQYDFRPQFWRNISSGAKDLVTRCLTINPNKRVDATTALNHEWMQVREDELATHSVNVDKLKSVMDAKRKMRAAVTTVGGGIYSSRVKVGTLIQLTHCFFHLGLVFISAHGGKPIEAIERRLFDISRETTRGLHRVALFVHDGGHQIGACPIRGR
jgi:serine/threonine protein kinase